ncbi:hypothetical protein EC973_006616 [Apophysomyces ossiformis]|uniref:Uncharacterized protein n=1 Tax=Apophysomyces ossiformis TaxID=679940 RepID=A0A8H7BQU7_9FUNG|nr:hypothetical protein EC973_006616 [Apophysomyces ossiformis]
MSFQSLLKREGWRPQNFSFFASAKVLCRNCLSRRLSLQQTAQIVTVTRPKKPDWSRHSVLVYSSPLTKQRRFLPRMQPISFLNPAKPEELSLIDQLRQELYYGADHADRLHVRSSVARRVVGRRKKRMKLLRLYGRLRQDPMLLQQLTDDDFSALVAAFTPNPDNKVVNKVSRIAVQILEDLSTLNSRNAQFTKENAENLVSFYRELGNLNQAQSTVEEMLKAGQTPSQETFAGLISLLSSHNRLEDAEAWLAKMKAYDIWPPSEISVAYIVEGWLRLGEKEKAIRFLTRYSGDINIFLKTSESAEDNYELLDIALDKFAKTCINDWRLNDARKFYQRRRELGLKTRHILNRLLGKSLYTFQTSVAHDLLEDTVKCEDKEGYRMVARKLLTWYLSREDAKQAAELWAAVNISEDVLGQQLCLRLIVLLAKSRHHVDLIRLYWQFKTRYPTAMTLDLYTTTLQGLIRSKQYALAREVFTDFKAKVPSIGTNQEVLLPLYSLCAQTGDIELFEEVLRMNEKVGQISHQALTSLIACYITACDLSAALSIFKKISHHAFSPDVVDFNLLIRLTAQQENFKEFSKILGILEHMRMVGVAPDETTLRTLLSIYKQGHIKDKLFEKLLNDPGASVADQIWINNIALTRLMAVSGPGQAAAVFLDNDRGALFESTKGEPIKADHITYKLLIDAAVERPRSMPLAHRLYVNMRAQGMKPPREIYHQMILGWARKGRLQRARRIMEEMEKDTGVPPDKRTYSMLIEGFLILNRVDLAREVIAQDMESHNIKPDKFMLRRIAKQAELLAQ